MLQKLNKSAVYQVKLDFQQRKHGGHSTLAEENYFFFTSLWGKNNLHLYNEIELATNQVL